jgi:hypothetical protein
LQNVFRGIFVIEAELLHRPNLDSTHSRTGGEFARLVLLKIIDRHRNPSASAHMYPVTGFDLGHALIPLPAERLLAFVDKYESIRFERDAGGNESLVQLTLGDAVRNDDLGDARSTVHLDK